MNESVERSTQILVGRGKGSDKMRATQLLLLLHFELEVRKLIINFSKLSESTRIFAFNPKLVK